MFDLTVIIPTFKEEANVARIISEVDAVFRKNGLAGEILVVDDNSPDGTIDKVKGLQAGMGNVNLVVRTSDHGLSQSVAEGFVRARSDVFIVTDADLSHPPALIPEMYRRIREGYDLVIGSRYMEGGGIKKWPLKRRGISSGATFLARLLFPDVTDPVSGFFAVRKSVVENAPLKPRGYKILLEVLGRGSWKKETEIPFEFVDREAGASKLKLKTIIEYARQVAEIAFFSVLHRPSPAGREFMRVFRFGLVGLSGIVVNLGVLSLFLMAGVSAYLALFFGIGVSLLTNFLLNDAWTFSDSAQKQKTSVWQRMHLFYIVSAGGAAINYGVAVLLKLALGTNIYLVDFLGILVGFAWNFLVNRRFTWGKR